jgi:tRNA(fMet)-specific endonuclease VapC
MGVNAINKTLIDTDTLSFFLRGRPEVTAHVGRYLAEHRQLNISVITYYEVLSGLRYRDARRQIDTFLELIRANRLLPLTEAACGHAASAHAALRKSGQAVAAPTHEHISGGRDAAKLRITSPSSCRKRNRRLS